MPPTSEYHLPSDNNSGKMPSQMQSPMKFGSAKVPAKKIFILGMILPLIAPSIATLVYVLAFIFNKETRREAAIIFVWLIVVGVATWSLEQYLGYNPQGYAAPAQASQTSY